MLEFILASGNSHKASEFSELFDPSIIKVIGASQKIEVIENGDSFTDNALLKAQSYYQKYKKPVLSDDSGLIVKALPGELGISSARFGGEGLTDKQRALLLLEKMQNYLSEERGAYFNCTLCFYFSPEEIFFFEGLFEGKIGVEYKGEHGFGYDPVFIPSGRTDGQSVAENPEWKKSHSHRAIAAKHALKFFKERNCQKL